MRRRYGYILVEALVALGLLSVSIGVIQGALHQAILTKGQANDYTEAKWVLESIMAQKKLEAPLQEGQGKGVLRDRYEYTWQVDTIDLPVPDMPLDAPPEQLQHFNVLVEQIPKNMGRLRVQLRWYRAGQLREVSAECLLAPDQLWQWEGGGG